MTLKYIPLCRRIPIAQSGGSSKSWRSTVYYDPTTGQYFSENREPLSVLHKLGDNPANWTYTDSQNRIYSPTNQNNQGEITQGKTPSFFDRFIANSERNYNNPILGVPARYSYAIKNNTDPVTGVVSFMPGVGDAIDIASAGINALRGNWGDAAVYGTAAALPVVGGKMLRAFTSKANKLKDEVFKPKLQDALNITPTTSSVDLSNLTRTETPTTRDPFSRERDILNRAAQAREDQYIRIGNAAAENKKMLDEQKINEAREAAAKARQDAFDRATRQYVTLSDDEVMSTYRKLAGNGNVTPEYEAILKEGQARNIFDNEGRVISRSKTAKPKQNEAQQGDYPNDQKGSGDIKTEETGKETTSTDQTKDKTRWQKVNNAGTNVTKTIKRIFRETKDDNFGNVFGIGYKGRNRIRVAAPLFVGGHIIGNIMGRIGGAATGNAGRFVGAFQKGYNEGAGISNPSTNQDTTKVNNQTSTQPIAPTKYPTLDSMDQVVNRELLYLDSLNHAN